MPELKAVLVVEEDPASEEGFPRGLEKSEKSVRGASIHRQMHLHLVFLGAPLVIIITLEAFTRAWECCRVLTNLDESIVILVPHSGKGGHSNLPGLATDTEQLHKPKSLTGPVTIAASDLKPGFPRCNL